MYFSQIFKKKNLAICFSPNQFTSIGGDWFSSVGDNSPMMLRGRCDESLDLEYKFISIFHFSTHKYLHQTFGRIRKIPKVHFSGLEIFFLQFRHSYTVWKSTWSCWRWAIPRSSRSNRPTQCPRWPNAAPTRSSRTTRAIASHCKFQKTAACVLSKINSIFCLMEIFH